MRETDPPNYWEVHDNSRDKGLTQGADGSFFPEGTILDNSGVVVHLPAPQLSDQERLEIQIRNADL